MFRAEPEKGMGDWRFYLCEPGVITVDDLPAGWGLLYVINGRVRKIMGYMAARKSSVGGYGCKTVQGKQTG